MRISYFALLKYVIKNSDGVTLSEDWTLFDEKGLIAFCVISIYFNKIGNFNSKSPSKGE